MLDGCISVNTRRIKNFFIDSETSIISFLFLCFFFTLFSNISFKWMKLETYSCTQNACLVILFPAVIKLLSYHCGEFLKIRPKLWYPDSNIFSSTAAKLDLPIFYIEMYLLNKKARNFRLCAFERAWNSLSNCPSLLLSIRSEKC